METESSAFTTDDDSQRNNSVTSIIGHPEKNVGSKMDQQELKWTDLLLPGSSSQDSCILLQKIDQPENLPCEARNVLLKHCARSPSAKPQLKALQACDTSIIGGFKKEDLVTKLKVMSILQRTRSMSENTEVSSNASSPTPSLWGEDISTDEEDCQVAKKPLYNTVLSENVRKLMNVYNNSLKNICNILPMPEKNKSSKLDEKICDPKTEIINRETVASSSSSETEEIDTFSGGSSGIEEDGARISPSQSSEAEDEEIVNIFLSRPSETEEEEIVTTSPSGSSESDKDETVIISSTKVSETEQCTETEGFESKISKENIEKPLKTFSCGEILKLDNAEIFESQFSIFYGTGDMDMVSSFEEELQLPNLSDTKTQIINRETVASSSSSETEKMDTFSGGSSRIEEEGTVRISPNRSSEIEDEEIANKFLSRPSETKEEKIVTTSPSGSSETDKEETVIIFSTKVSETEHCTETEGYESKISKENIEKPLKTFSFGETLNQDNAEIFESQFSIFYGSGDMDMVSSFEEELQLSNPEILHKSDLVPDSQKIFSDCCVEENFEERIKENVEPSNKQNFDAKKISLIEQGQFENSRKIYFDNPEISHNSFRSPSPTITLTRDIIPQNEFSRDIEISRYTGRRHYVTTPDVSPSADPFNKRKKVEDIAGSSLPETGVLPKTKKVIDLVNLTITKIDDTSHQTPATLDGTKSDSTSRLNETSLKELLISTFMKTHKCADINVPDLKTETRVDRGHYLTQLNKIKEFLRPTRSCPVYERGDTRDIWSLIITEPSDEVRRGLLEYRNYIECILMSALAPFEPITYSEFLPQFVKSINKLSYHPNTDILEAHTYVEDLSALFKRQILEKNRGIKHWSCISNTVRRLKYIQESLDRYEEIKTNDDVPNELSFEAAVKSATRRLVISDVKFKLITRDKYRMVVRKLPVANYGNAENMYFSDYDYEFSRITVGNLLKLHPRSEELLVAIDSAHRILFDYNPYKLYVNALNTYFDNVLLKILIGET